MHAYTDGVDIAAFSATNLKSNTRVFVGERPERGVVVLPLTTFVVSAFDVSAFDVVPFPLRAAALELPAFAGSVGSCNMDDWLRIDLS